MSERIDGLELQVQKLWIELDKRGQGRPPIPDPMPILPRPMPQPLHFDKPSEKMIDTYRRFIGEPPVDMSKRDMWQAIQDSMKGNDKQ